MNNDVKKKQKMSCVLGKTMENVIKHRKIKLITTERRGSYLVPQQIIFHRKLISNRNEKINRDTYE